MALSSVEGLEGQEAARSLRAAAQVMKSPSTPDVCSSYVILPLFFFKNFTCSGLFLVHLLRTILSTFVQPSFPSKIESKISPLSILIYFLSSFLPVIIFIRALLHLVIMFPFFILQVLVSFSFKRVKPFQYFVDLRHKEIDIRVQTMAFLVMIYYSLFGLYQGYRGHTASSLSLVSSYQNFGQIFSLNLEASRLLPNLEETTRSIAILKLIECYQLLEEPTIFILRLLDCYQLLEEPDG